MVIPNLGSIGLGKSVANVVVVNLPGAALGVLVLAAVAAGAGISYLHEIGLAVRLVGSVVAIRHLVVDFNYTISQRMSS